MWTASYEFGTYRLCEQRRFRRVCASAQSRQNLRCSLIQAVNQEEPSDRKSDPWPLWMAGHAQLKYVMTECSKTQIRLTGLMLNWSKEVKSHLIFSHRFNTELFIFEPRQANLCLRAFRHDKFQLRMPSHLERPGIWLSVWRFLLTHCWYERAAKVLARLCRCAGSPEPSLLA